MSLAAPCRLLLRAPVTQRQLELTLDSLLAQTDPDFELHAIGLPADAAALVARYGDPRFHHGGERAPADSGLVSLVPPGALYQPTWLARLRGVLDADPTLQAAACAGSVFDGTALLPAPPSAAGALFRAPAADLSELPAGTAMLPDRLIVLRCPGPPPPVQRRLPMRLFGLHYTPSAWEAERPPTLHVVVDTEAEFDWEDGAFGADLNAISALGAIETGQEIFDRYGLRPVYLIDYPVAAQPGGIAAIGAIAARGGCAIGAHLHPWTNPPFARSIDRRLSYPGNLTAAEERDKLSVLLATIEQNFGVRPAFYKAGRYGLGPNTARLVAEAGLQVDYSLMPETDLRDAGGPDFRAVAAIPYDVASLNLLAMPMTRADLGPLSQYWNLRQWLDSRSAAMLHVRGVLARTGLMERLTLTPEGVSAKLQLVLLQTLLKRGHRSFVLHFHSPSLAVGHTPYVRSEADRVEFLDRIDIVCRWFFEELGGLPGRPWDLLPVEARRA